MAVNEVYFEHPHEQPLQVQEPPPLHPHGQPPAERDFPQVQLEEPQPQLALVILNPVDIMKFVDAVLFLILRCV